MVIGITGGVGAGKSKILSYMKSQYGAAVLAADDIAHELMEPGRACYEPVIGLFGKGILKEDCSIDRKRLGDMVFSHKNLLLKLNAIIHPAVKSYIREEIKRIKEQDERQLVLIEAALLIEDHYEEICDELWYIYADEEVRKDRLKKYRGYSEEKAGSIMKNQLSEAEYRRNCQKIIDNGKDMEKTKEEIKKALEF